MHRDW